MNTFKVSLDSLVSEGLVDLISHFRNSKYTRSAIEIDASELLGRLHAAAVNNFEKKCGKTAIVMNTAIVSPDSNPPKGTTKPGDYTITVINMDPIDPANKKSGKSRFSTAGDARKGLRVYLETFAGKEIANTLDLRALYKSTIEYNGKNHYGYVLPFKLTDSGKTLEFTPPAEAKDIVDNGKSTEVKKSVPTDSENKADDAKTKDSDNSEEDTASKETSSTDDSTNSDSTEKTDDGKTNKKTKFSIKKKLSDITHDISTFNKEINSADKYNALLKSIFSAATDNKIHVNESDEEEGSLKTRLKELFNKYKKILYSKLNKLEFFNDIRTAISKKTIQKKETNASNDNSKIVELSDKIENLDEKTKAGIEKIFKSYRNFKTFINKNKENSASSIISAVKPIAAELYKDISSKITNLDLTSKLSAKKEIEAINTTLLAVLYKYDFIKAIDKENINNLLLMHKNLNSSADYVKNLKDALEKISSSLPKQAKTTNNKDNADEEEKESLKAAANSEDRSGIKKPTKVEPGSIFASKESFREWFLKQKENNIEPALTLFKDVIRPTIIKANADADKKVIDELKEFTLGSSIVKKDALEAFELVVDFIGQVFDNILEEDGEIYKKAESQICEHGFDNMLDFIKVLNKFLPYLAFGPQTVKKFNLLKHKKLISAKNKIFDIDKVSKQNRPLLLSKYPEELKKYFPNDMEDELSKINFQGKITDSIINMKTKPLCEEFINSVLTNKNQNYTKDLLKTIINLKLEKKLNESLQINESLFIPVSSPDNGVPEPGHPHDRDDIYLWEIDPKYDEEYIVCTCRYQNVAIMCNYLKTECDFDNYEYKVEWPQHKPDIEKDTWKSEPSGKKETKKDLERKIQQTIITDMENKHGVTLDMKKFMKSKGKEIVFIKVEDRNKENPTPVYTFSNWDEVKDVAYYKDDSEVTGYRNDGHRRVLGEKDKS